jgi:hypothetical protein
MPPRYLTGDLSNWSAGLVAFGSSSFQSCRYRLIYPKGVEIAHRAVRIIRVALHFLTP